MPGGKRTATARRRLGRTLVVNTLVPAAFCAGYAGASQVMPVAFAVPEPASPVAAGTDPRETEIRGLEKRYGCSRTGLAPGVAPRHTIVLDARGAVRLTSFDVGWSMYERRTPGTLVSVCVR
jgi:hypothetical protein